jgi:hypothetical protein
VRSPRHYTRRRYAWLWLLGLARMPSLLPIAAECKGRNKWPTLRNRHTSFIFCKKARKHKHHSFLFLLSAATRLFSKSFFPALSRKMKLSLYILSLSTVAFAQSLAPSPTESVGCEAHEDHWHCDGPVSTTQTGTITATSLITTTTAATSTSSEEEDHDHESGTGSLAPSPTESVGCEPHGDHW